jgi:hypothetical protein
VRKNAKNPKSSATEVIQSALTPSGCWQRKCICFFGWLYDSEQRSAKSGTQAAKNAE